MGHLVSCERPTDSITKVLQPYSISNYLPDQGGINNNIQCTMSGICDNAVAYNINKTRLQQ